jgi:RpiR family carbohydrate utilization transcriptional regulator
MVEGGCIYAIKSRYRGLSEKERRIADWILANLDEAVHPSIDELAERIGISESTLVRFVRKLGYNGYRTFRIALATETAAPAERYYETPIGEHDDEVEVVFSSAVSTLELTRRTLDRAALDKAADLIASSRRLMLFGTGGSGIVAKDAFHKLVRTGVECIAAEDYHLQLMIASQACAGCAALVVSHTGTNMDTLAISVELERAGCPIIVLTSNPHSPLAKSGTVVLSVRPASSSFVSEAFSARIAHLVVVDALYVELMKRFGLTGVAHLEAMRRSIAPRRL